MANYEQAGIEAVNRLWQPMSEGLDTQHQLQRQAAGVDLQRRLQLADAATKRDQELVDASTKRDQELVDARTKRTQQLDDAKLAHTRGLDRITHQLTKADEIDDADKVADRARQLKEDREEIAASVERLRGDGIDLGITIADVQKATPGRLRSFARDLNMELEIIKLNKKDRYANLDKLTSLAKKPENAEVFKEVLGLGDEDLDTIDTSEFSEYSNATIVDMLAEASLKIKVRKFGPSIVPEFKRLKRIQHRLHEETGIMDAMRSGEPQKPLTDLIIADPLFQNALGSSGLSDTERQTLINRLTAGDLQGASEYLNEEGEMGNTPLTDALTRAMAKQQATSAMGVQGVLFEQQGAGAKLRAINEQLRDMVQRHPWIEETVDVTDIFSSKEFDERVNKGGGVKKDDGLGKVGDAEKDLVLSSEDPEVGVEGGMPPQEKLKIANEILGEGYGGWFGARYLKPGVGTWPNMGPFGDNKTLTPDQRITEATNKVISDIRELNLKLDRLGASKVNGRPTIKPGMGDGIDTTYVEFTEEELNERGSQAVELFKALEKAEAQLKSLQGNAPRRTGFGPALTPEDVNKTAP